MDTWYLFAAFWSVCSPMEYQSDEDDFDVSKRSLAPQAKTPSEEHKLLVPLASAQEAVTRLDALASMGSPDVVEGLRARMAFREAAGLLAYAHVWVHPLDLALRASHHTSSYASASLKGDLRPALPNTMTGGYRPDSVPDDTMVDQALRYAGLWRRLGDLTTWFAGVDGDLPVLEETLGKLGWHGELDENIRNWVERVRKAAPFPALLQAGWAGRSWGNLPGNLPDLTPDGAFLATAVWKKKGQGRSIPLPFWSAPNTLHNRLSVKTGIDWSVAWLDVVERAAKLGLDELHKLRFVEAQIEEIPAKTKRAKLPVALRFAIRQPIFTASSLARHAKITAPAASALVNQLEEAGLIREATKRRSWRAFVLK
jgi:hypothetical protein